MGDADLARFAVLIRVGDSIRPHLQLWQLSTEVWISLVELKIRSRASPFKVKRRTRTDRSDGVAVETMSSSETASVLTRFSHDPSGCQVF
jgi:hypothetical protein